MSKTSPAPETCPCGRPLPYDACCGRYHQGPLHLQAPDPETLMRSRYTAFVLNVGAYLLNTWHPSTRPAQIEAPEAGLRWLGLTVREARLADEACGTVSFVARYKLGGRAFRMEEVSRFVREEGHWYYVDALPQG